MKTNKSIISDFYGKVNSKYCNVIQNLRVIQINLVNFVQNCILKSEKMYAII